MMLTRLVALVLNVATLNDGEGLRVRSTRRLCDNANEWARRGGFMLMRLRVLDATT